MSAGEHNVAISMRLFQLIQPPYSRINKAGVKVEKLTATSQRVTVQLSSHESLHQLFPDAGLRTHDGKSFYEFFFDHDCRLVWEATTNEH